jgi:hypothetical protein
LKEFLNFSLLQTLAAGTKTPRFIRSRGDTCRLYKPALDFSLTAEGVLKFEFPAFCSGEFKWGI